MLETLTEKTVTSGPATRTPGAGKRRRWAGRTRRAAGTALLLAVMGMAAVVALSLAGGRWMASPVLSGSMRPGFAVGGLVIGERVPTSSVSVRDVIVFRNPDNGEQMVHRVIWVQPDGSAIRIRTQGDANSAADPWTATITQPYLYRIRYSLPLVGYMVVAFQNHRGYVLLVAGVVLLAVGATSMRDRRPAATGESVTLEEETTGAGAEG